MKQTISNMDEIDLPDFHASDSEWDEYFRKHPEDAKNVNWQFTTPRKRK